MTANTLQGTVCTGYERGTYDIKDTNCSSLCCYKYTSRPSTHTWAAREVRCSIGDSEVLERNRSERWPRRTHHWRWNNVAVKRMSITIPEGYEVGCGRIRKAIEGYIDMETGIWSFQTHARAYFPGKWDREAAHLRIWYCTTPMSLS